MHSHIEHRTSVLDDACAIATVPDKDTVPVAVLSGAAGVPHLSPVAGSDELSMKDIYPTFWRTSTSDLARMSVFVDYLCHEVGTRHLILLHEQIPAKVARASSLLQSAAASCPDMDVRTIGVPGTKAVSDEDAERVLDDIEESGYRHIFSLAAKEQLYRLLELGVDRGVAANPDYFWSANVPKHDPAAEGSNLERALRGLASIELNENIADGQYQKFDEVFGSLTPDDVKLVEGTLPYPNATIPPPLLKKPVINIPYFMYDAIVALGLAACAADKQDGSYFDGAQLFEALLQTTVVDGTTGNEVRFDANGSRDPASATFTIVNWLPGAADEDGLVTMSNEVTAIFQNGAWKPVAQFLYNGVSEVAPLDSPVPDTDYNYLGTGLRAAGLTLCAIALAASLGWMIWTKHFEKEKVVKASQPIFLGIICAGTALLAAAIIPMSVDDEVASPEGCSMACMSIPYLLCIGFTLVFAALLAKLMRVRKLFSNQSMRRIKVTPKDVIKPLVGLLFANILVLGLWTGLNPLVWEREVTEVDKFGNPVESVGRCSFEGSLPYVIVLLVLDLGAMVFALYEAWRCRKISLEFAESSYIASAIGVTLLVCFVGIPVVIIASGNLRAQFFVTSCIVFVICTSLLTFIFVPKEQARRSKKDMKAAIKSSMIGKGSTFSRKDSNASGEGGTPVQTGVQISMASTASDEGDGLRVLNNPKTMAELEEKNRAMKREIAELRQQLAKRRSSSATVPETDESETFLSTAEEGEDAC